MRRYVGLIVALAIVALVVAACGGGSEDRDTGDDAESGSSFAAQATPAPFPTPAPSASTGAFGDDGRFGTRGPAGAAGPPALGLPPLPGQPFPGDAKGVRADEVAASVQARSLLLDVLDRQVISTASIILVAEDVDGALAQVRLAAEALGGFVETLSSRGDGKDARANITVRVPAAQFFEALERIEALGDVRQRNLGSEDVTEQHIDLEARLRSAERQEASLLALVERAENVNEILTLEREISRVRSDIEHFQGQLTFLERRIDLATISVALLSPQAELGVPPSADVGVAVDDVSGAVASVRATVERLGGKIDSSFVSVRGEVEQAQVAFRVFRDGFDAALASVEGLGELEHKEVRQGNEGDADAPRPEEPGSRVVVTLSQAPEEEDGSPVAGIVLVSVGGPLAAIGLVYGAFRLGRRQGGATP